MAAGRSTTIALLVACASGACGPAEPDGAPGSTLVRQDIGDARYLSLTEELRLGGSAEETSFYVIRGLALDGSGNVYVLDAGNHRVAVYDPSGRLLRRFGQEGEGPGDFLQPGALWLASDTLAITDRGNRVHFFLTDGTHLRTRSYAGLATGDTQWLLAGVVHGPEGWLLTGSAFFRRDAAGSDVTLPPVVRARLFRVGTDGEIAAAGLYWEHPSEGRWDGPFWVQAPFAYAPRMGVDGLGRAHVAMSGDYVIDVYDASGQAIRRIENDVSRIPVEGEMLDRWKELRACRPGQPECSDARTEMALAMPRSEYVYVVEEIRGFVGGYTAIRRSGTDPDPTDRVVLGEYDFFDPDGRYMGTLPAGSSPRWFDGEVLLVTEWDDMQVPSVVRYRVEPPSEG